MQTWKEPKALYRLLDEPDVSFAALMQPHFQQTREQALSSPVMLLVQETTDIDLSHRHSISGVGQIGNERGRGFFLQTVLAVRPQTREVLGCMTEEPFVRVPAPKARTTASTAQAARAGMRCLDPVLATWHIGSKIRPLKRENAPHPPCKQRRVGVQSDLVNRIPLAGMPLFSW
jgi:hypothetical protein